MTNENKVTRVGEVAKEGIRSSEDIKRLMCELIPDILDGGVSVPVANATCNATGKLIKMVELELKYGSGELQRREGKRSNTLELISGK